MPNVRVSWADDNLGEARDHTYRVVVDSPVRRISALQLLDKHFLAFLNGRALFPFPHDETHYTERSFPFRLNPFRSTFRIETVTERPGTAWINRWTAEYSCQCPEPLSLFCQSLASLLATQWYQRLLKNPPLEEPFPIHLDRYVNTLCNHCGRCRRLPPTAILDMIINLYLDSPSHFARISAQRNIIRIDIPRSHRHFSFMPCFLAVIKHFPHAVVVSFC